MKKTFLLRLFACVLAAIPAALAQVKFRVIFDGNSSFYEPVSIAQLSPDVFIWDSRAYYIVSVTPKGEVALLASAPSGYFVSVPFPGPESRGYSSAVAGGSTPPPPEVISFTAKPGGQRTYSPQSLSAGFSASLPDSQLLGFGADSEGTGHIITGDAQGNVASVYQFPPHELAVAGPIYASDGNYYGILWGEYGPEAGASYVFRVTPSGALTALYNFPLKSFASGFNGSLVQGADGNLYGTIPFGGANGEGAFFQLTLAGQYTLIYSFQKSSGAPGSLFQASDGNFYGVTGGIVDPPGPGVIFGVTAAGQYSELYKMSGRDGGCSCELMQGSDGILYGVAEGGGAHGIGTIFALNVGLPKPAPQALSFSPAQGAVGARVRIWGYNLLSSSVQFNGVAAAAVEGSGPNYVYAAVPAGATSGPITVTTPGGTSTTTAAFTVK